MPDLLDHETPDEEDFVVSWLQSVMRSATERKSDDELPFAQVQYIVGSDDECYGTSDGVIQVDFFDTAREGMTAAQAAKETSRIGHRSMMYLARYVPEVVVSNGCTVCADYVNCTMKPVRMPYANERVVRYTARYELGLSYVAVNDES